MFKKGVILSVAAGIALVGWWAFNAAQARVCFLPDSDCDMDNSQGLADGEHLPDPVPNSECGGYNLSYSETASYDKNCYECESCTSKGVTKYKCQKKNDMGEYTLNASGNCVKNEVCDPKYNLTEKKDANCWDCTPCTSNGVTKYECKEKTNMGNYEISGNECVQKSCPTGFVRDVTCKEPKVEHETVKGCYICDDCENGAKHPGCKAGYKETDTGKKSSYSQSVCYVCEKDGCDFTKGEYSSQFECEDHECQGEQNCHCTQDNETRCWIRPNVLYVDVIVDQKTPSYFNNDDFFAENSFYDYNIWMHSAHALTDDAVLGLNYYVDPPKAYDPTKPYNPNGNINPKICYFTANIILPKGKNNSAKLWLKDDAEDRPTYSWKTCGRAGHVDGSGQFVADGVSTEYGYSYDVGGYDYEGIGSEGFSVEYDGGGSGDGSYEEQGGYEGYTAKIHHFDLTNFSLTIGSEKVTDLRHLMEEYMVVFNGETQCEMETKTYPEGKYTVVFKVVKPQKSQMCQYD